MEQESKVFGAKDQQLEDKRTIIKCELQGAIDSFNLRFREWESRFGCQANFKWGYLEDGRKLLTISSINMPIVEEDVSESRVKEAENILSSAANINF